MSKGITKIQLALSVAKGKRIELNLVRAGVNDAARERTPSAGARELNIWDLDYYLEKRQKELDREIAEISGQVIMVQERDDTRLLS